MGNKVMPTHGLADDVAPVVEAPDILARLDKLEADIVKLKAEKADKIESLPAKP